MTICIYALYIQEAAHSIELQPNNLDMLCSLFVVSTGGPSWPALWHQQEVGHLHSVSSRALLRETLHQLYYSRKSQQIVIDLLFLHCLETLETQQQKP